MHAADLAPGDSRSLERDWQDVQLHEIRSVDDPAFRMAYDALWEQFGAINEVESARVLAQRMHWELATPRDGYHFDYRLELVTSGGSFAAVVDHTIAIPENGNHAIVHISHILIAPEWRRSGLAGWMRALPLRDARQALATLRRPADSPITLAAEVEHLDETIPATATRLKTFTKAGYLKIDPAKAPFLQPDFRSEQEIERTGGPRPVPLTLVLRQIPQQEAPVITGAEVRKIVTALYSIYGATFREKDMTLLWQNMATYPKDDEPVKLLPPY